MNAELNFDTYQKIARDWHNDHRSDDWWVEGTDVLCSYLEQGARVLDVGCAGGVKSRHLVGKGLDVVGIDFVPEFIDIAKKEVPEAMFHTMDMYDVSALEGMFDAVFAQASLLHIPKKDMQKVLQELLTKLKSGGYFYIAMKRIRDGQDEEEVKVEDDYGYEYKRFFSYVDEEELRGLLQSVGLRIVYEHEDGSGPSRWLQTIAQKV